MSFKIVRNDIVKMDTEAIVNTANAYVSVGSGCDYAVYTAAGFDELLQYRREHIGVVEEGGAFITPGFRLPAKHIIHAVSPFYEGGGSGEEEKLRSCYRKSLALAREHGIKSIAFPLIATGSFGYPKEEGMRIAVDEIHAFLLENEMDICLVVFDTRAAELGERLYPGLEAYIDRHYVRNKQIEEYEEGDFVSRITDAWKYGADIIRRRDRRRESVMSAEADFESLQSKLDERMKHLSDTFSEYLLYLIRRKGMDNVDVYKRAIVGKKTFSKIKNNPNYHPQKMTALCLCVGAKLSIDETKDLLARAGFALSPCDKTDVIFSYFIEMGIYDMIELDIQLEEHGLPCIIE